MSTPRQRLAAQPDPGPAARRRASQGDQTAESENGVNGRDDGTQRRVVNLEEGNVDNDAVVPAHGGATNLAPLSASGDEGFTSVKWTWSKVATILGVLLAIVFGTGAWVGGEYANRVASTGVEIAKYELCADHQELRDTPKCQEIMRSSLKALHLDKRSIHPMIRDHEELHGNLKHKRRNTDMYFKDTAKSTISQTSSLLKAVAVMKRAEAACGRTVLSKEFKKTISKLPTKGRQTCIKLLYPAINVDARVGLANDTMVDLDSIRRTIDKSTGQLIEEFEATDLLHAELSAVARGVRDHGSRASFPNSNIYEFGPSSNNPPSTPHILLTPTQYTIILRSRLWTSLKFDTLNLFLNPHHHIHQLLTLNYILSIFTRNTRISTWLTMDSLSFMLSMSTLLTTLQANSWFWLSILITIMVPEVLLDVKYRWGIIPSDETAKRLKSLNIPSVLRPFYELIFVWKILLGILALFCMEVSSIWSFRCFMVVLTIAAVDWEQYVFGMMGMWGFVKEKGVVEALPRILVVGLSSFALWGVWRFWGEFPVECLGGI